MYAIEQAQRNAGEARKRRLRQMVQSVPKGLSPEVDNLLDQLTKMSRP